MKNLLLTCFSLIITYLFLEFVVFYYAMPFLPLKLHGHVDEGIQILLQSSKKATIPKDYIAIVGDSYAKGYGDWLFSANPDSNPPFHSAHIINDLTGRDVVNFGLSGAGSLIALLAQPIPKFQFINSSFRFEMDQPSRVVVYFYEGNDLNNNLSELRKITAPESNKNANYYLSHPEEFRQKIDTAMIKNDPLHERSKTTVFSDELYGLYFVDSMLSITLPVNQPRKWTIGGNNLIIVNGKLVAAPDALQSPALELTEDEINLSVYVFEQSLTVLQSYFNKSRFVVVYIPSPLASYKLGSEFVDIETYEGRSRRYPASFVAERSSLICNKILNVARQQGIDFVDSRASIRELASKEIIHGPLDWWHFNQSGYTALGHVVADYIKKPGANGCVIL